MNFNYYKKLFGVTILVLALSGCAVIFQKGRRSDLEKIDELSAQLEELNRAKKILEDRLSGEIKDKQVRLQMMEKGLVVTFVADIIFDSGKAEIKREALPILNKVSRVLEENVPELSVGIEGHTDNVPIKVSGWKSNWELSTSRALSVLHYLVDKQGLNPSRLSAIGYGENWPVASNSTSEGRRMNRRVEIVILPKITKSQGKNVAPVTTMTETEENLK